MQNKSGYLIKCIKMEWNGMNRLLTFCVIAQVLLISQTNYGWFHIIEFIVVILSIIDFLSSKRYSANILDKNCTNCPCYSSKKTFTPYQTSLDNVSVGLTGCNRCDMTCTRANDSTFSSWNNVVQFKKFGQPLHQPSPNHSSSWACILISRNWGMGSLNKHKN